MKKRSLLAVALAMAVALSLPVVAFSQDRGRRDDSGDRSGYRDDHSGERRTRERRSDANRGNQTQERRQSRGDQGWNRGGDSRRGDQGWNRGGDSHRGDQGWNRGGDSRRGDQNRSGDRNWNRDRSSDRNWNQRSPSGDQGWNRGPSRNPGSQTWRIDPRRSGSGGSYTPQTRYRTDTRWRGDGQWSGGSGYRTYNRVYSRGGYGGGYSRGGYGGGYYAPRYRSGFRFAPTRYYIGHFHRPHFVYRSGFSIGFVIAPQPLSGYGWYDPYCDADFDNLEEYYGHCGAQGHEPAFLLLDASDGQPVATCVYDGGDWVVGDLAGDEYDNY